MANNRLRWTEKDIARLPTQVSGDALPSPKVVTRAIHHPTQPEPWPKLNKWEREFGLNLELQHPNSAVLAQGLTFRLAKATSYTPDWIVAAAEGRLHAYEVKGFWRQAGRVKLKLAARLFPWVTFIAVTRPNGKAGGWQMEVISP